MKQSIAREAILVALLSIAMPSVAEGMRCGTQLVDEGDPQIKVFKFCGEPSWSKVWTVYRSGFPAARPHGRLARELADDELVWHRKSTVAVEVEQWTYNFGPRRFMKQLRFENGVLVDVDTLGYGFVE